jgi:carbamoyl-phosphate synthase small subunit
MQGRDLARAAGCAEAYRHTGKTAPTEENAPSLQVAVLDFGVKRSILDGLQARGMTPTVWPAATPAGDILDSCPDGLLLSNGPGDPEPCGYAVATVRQLLGRLPLFGICLGHQILSLALGAGTYKLPFGHHGVNHPVKDLRSGRVWITSQNHGFCVDPDSLPAGAEPSHINLNDQTLEGLVCRDIPAFSVQFHPEAGPGPHDAAGLFTRFRDLILSFKQQRQGARTCQDATTYIQS